MTRLSPEIEKLIEEKVESMGVKKYIDEYVREGFRLGVEMAIETVMRLPVTRSEMVGVIEPVVSRIHALATPQAEKEDGCPPHEWDRSGERCTKCGDKDWMT